MIPLELSSKNLGNIQPFLTRIFVAVTYQGTFFLRTYFKKLCWYLLKMFKLAIKGILKKIRHFQK